MDGEEKGWTFLVVLNWSYVWSFFFLLPQHGHPCYDARARENS